MSEKKILRWGLLGSGIILDRWLRGALHAEGSRITAISSRTAATAEAMAGKWNIGKVLTYDQMIHDPDIDVVYIPVPHQAHHDLAIRAMNAGKHVLVEKPAAVTAAEFREMADCARENRVFLMEAVWTYFFPAVEFIRKMIREKQIGDVRTLQATFSFRTADGYQGRLLNPANAGGGLLDVGVYDLHFAQNVFDKDPEQIEGFASIDTDELHLQIDEQAAFVARYDKGELALMASGVRTKMEDTAYIYGTDGYLIVPRFWSPDSVVLVRGTERTEYAFPVEQKDPSLPDEGFRYEVEHVNRCILDGLTESPVVPLSRTLSVLRQCDILRKEWGLRYPFEQE
ncbi:MAG: Gfo/Idh/MocA family oxidoreductase [Clostridia bacterium]|nr:Gfo/Idh/MocA family oxidoreductase [Clostridia bacterium]